MIAAPMLADFAIRLAFGLAASILLIPWRSVPLPFYRTQAYVILGLLVLAALNVASAGAQTSPLVVIVTAAISAYCSAVAWGLGLPNFGRAAAGIAVLAAGGWLAAASESAGHGLWAVNLFARVTSGFLLGATLTAMLLGHYYLTAPAMTVEPLKRIVSLTAWGLGARCAIASIALATAHAGSFGVGPLPSDSATRILLVVRWGMGFVAAGISIYLTWKTAEIRSTQSATGILYITMIFVCFGELTSLVLAAREGVSV
jgi:hypothetical protein